MSVIMSGLAVDLARAVTKTLLSGDETRWRHTIGVAARADEVAITVPAADREMLVAAAWLHDVGYSQELAKTGFHPLDGAAFLLRTGWPMRIAALVAHHSGAEIVARFNGCGDALADYPHETGAVADALTYADQTTGPVGQRVDVRARIDEAVRRHGPKSIQARANPIRSPYLLALASRVQTRLATLNEPELSSRRG
jgi:putative nucleotidyltransferase with HDIG domain